MVEGEIPGDRLQPSAGTRTRSQLVEPLVSLEKDLLRDVLRLCSVSGEPNGCREDHVLVRPHERCEVARSARARWWSRHGCVITYAKNTAGAGKLHICTQVRSLASGRPRRERPEGKGGAEAPRKDLVRRSR